MSRLRTQWLAIGAAVAVALGTGGAVGVRAGVSSGERTVYVPITPCRLFDTRADSTVGQRNTPLGPGETYTVAAHGTNGQCTLPDDAAGVTLNVTAVGATELTYLTLWPADAPKPLASSLNPAPGAGPTPNAVVTDLAADGTFSIFNFVGRVDVLADVVGYYVGHDHDDRYYTRAEVDQLIAAATAPTAPALTHMSIAATAFTARVPLTDRQIGSGAQLYVPMGGQVADDFIAAVNLPDGSRLSAMRASVWDDATLLSLNVTLYRIPTFNPVFDTIYGVVSAADAPGTLNLLDDVPANQGVTLVDNSAFNYVVMVSPSGGNWNSVGTDLRFQGVVIDYTPA